MDKNKLIVFLFSMVLIAYITAVSIKENSSEPLVQHVSITQSAESSTDDIALPNTSAITSTSSKTRRKSAITTTVCAASVEENITVTSEPEPMSININCANEAELSQLPGIGEVLSGRIVEYRANYGDFRNIEEIMLVDGIGDQTFNEICGYIYVDDPVYDTSIISEPEIIDEPLEELIEEPSDEETDIPELTLDDVIPIDINTADVGLLMMLPYVNEDIALKIIQLREEIGGYSHPYEIYYIVELEMYQVNEISEFVTVGH